MSVLSLGQTLVVGSLPDLPDGVALPPIDLTIHDLGEVANGDYQVITRDARASLPDRSTSRPSALGWMAVYKHDGKWFFTHTSRGGGGRSIGYLTRDEALAEAQRNAGFTIQFWADKIAWRLDGDQALGRDRFERTVKQRVIRSGGHHYVLGAEPTDAEHAANNRYGCYGFGGRQLAFRLLDTGEIVQSRNVWSQGDIPAEFAELLPDNAERVDSDEDRRRREATEKWQAKCAAQQQERAWKDEALRAWRGPAAELRAHELLVAHEAAYQEEWRRQGEVSDAQELADRWAQEAVRAWRGSWVDLIGTVQRHYEEEQEYYAEMYEAARDAGYYL